MSQNFVINKGLNIRLAGEAPLKTITLPMASLFALQPDDFKNLDPKLLVKAGDEVEAGSPLFYDRKNESIKISSPVSGEVVDIVRGDKRKILSVNILADKTTRYKSFHVPGPNNSSRDEIIAALLASGIWAMIRQRPFGTIANPVDQPKSIFVSAFDTNPLAPDYSYLLNENFEDLQAGLSVLKALTTGPLHFNIHNSQSNDQVFSRLKDVVINEFSGPHPAGNIGTQIHHIDPLNKAEVIWYVNPQDVIIIGRLFSKGIYDARKTVVVAGSQVDQPQYYSTLAGTTIKEMLTHSGLKPGAVRIISGSVLSGRKIPADGFLGFYDAQLTVIPEGDQPEFMGWLAPGLKKFSISRTFFSWMKPGQVHDLDTNMHGEERPFVMTGEYEKVFPMNIYPVQLLKSILIEDIEMMEKLGIYEVVEEDFALCEVICTSKIKSQDIISRGIEIMQKEFS
jgi:Na+-transporting NADH:ubiquinone oxidoreductase subunit A